MSAAKGSVRTGASLIGDESGAAFATTSEKLGTIEMDLETRWHDSKTTASKLGTGVAVNREAKRRKETAAAMAKW